MTSLHSARSRLAQLRNKLHAELSALKTSSSIYKQQKGRLGGVMDCIQILDEEMLAGEQGKAQEVPKIGTMAPIPWLSHDLRPDQVAWLNARRGDDTTTIIKGREYQ